MDKCLEFNENKEKISLHADGRLSDAETAELMEHVGSCPSCRVYFNRYAGNPHVGAFRI